MAPLADTCYERLLRPFLFTLEPERAKSLTITALGLISAISPSADLPELKTEVFGLSFSNPVGLAAGLDKDARAIRPWNALGFGFAELGTITPRPQPGNPPPRIWRLPENRALINRLGFPSDGAETIARRIERFRAQPLRMRLGVNLGPNKNTPAEGVAGDIAALVRRLGPMADFVVVNLSSPNTPGLREFQAPERLRAIIESIRSTPPASGCYPPLLIKLAPDLEPTQLHEICAAALELGLNGIVATNTTVKRAEVGVESRYEGGLSGEPLKLRAREMIAQIHSDTQGRMPIIGVGGISTAEDAYGHICAGASLVEFYTGLIYRGPTIVSVIKAGIARLLQRDGFRSINEAVGSKLRK
jgi:dihydroorotate dehydrogenase